MDLLWRLVTLSPINMVIISDEDYALDFKNGRGWMQVAIETRIGLSPILVGLTSALIISFSCPQALVMKDPAFSERMKNGVFSLL